MATGIPGLTTPYTGGEFNDFVEKLRSHHWDASGQLKEIAAELRFELRDYMRKSPDFGAASGAIIARRITRPLVIASRLELDIAKHGLDSYNVFLDTIVNRGRTAARPSGRTFDPNK